MTQLESGQSLASRFSLIRRLGRGGMGDVWLARDVQLGTELVAKILPADATAEQISLLRQECRNARRLSHPHIVRVFDFHEDPIVCFMTMEFVAGGDLCDLRGAPVSQVIQTVLPLIDALEYAHGEGVVHRDIKCSNVLIDAGGRPRLSDFGIAGLSAPGPSDLRLQGGGSGRHASPQQLAGEAPSVADDIYGLGVMLRQLLGHDKLLPKSLESLIESMTAPAVESRPADLGVVRSALLAHVGWQEEEDTIPPQIAKREVRLSPPPRVPAVRVAERETPSRVETVDDSEPRRHPYWWPTVTAFVVLAVVVFAVFSLLPKWVDRRAASEIAAETRPDPAPAEQDASSAVDSSAESEPAAGAESDPVPAKRDGAAATVSETEIQESANPEAVVGEPETVEVPEMTSPAVEPRGAATSRPVAPVPKRDPTAEEFAEAMSRGLAAFESADYEEAQRAFENAVSLSPDSAEAADGLARTQQALRLGAITQHRQRAVDFERQERWREAEAEYKAALALDSALRFAREGEARSRERAVLSEKMRYHISHPDRLVEDQVLDEAREVLAEAQEIESVTPEMHKQIATLQKVVEVAATPVQVILVSDNSTEVVVYRVGRLGRFERRELELRPGTYTVVGRRNGYRDVRRQLRVEADGQGQSFAVRCEEKI